MTFFILLLINSELRSAAITALGYALTELQVFSRQARNAAYDTTVECRGRFTYLWCIETAEVAAMKTQMLATAERQLDADVAIEGNYEPLCTGVIAYQKQLA